MASSMVELDVDFEGASAKGIERLGDSAFSFALRVDCKGNRYFAVRLENPGDSAAEVDLSARIDPDFPDRPFRVKPTVWVERGGVWGHLSGVTMAEDRRSLSMAVDLAAGERLKVAGAPTVEFGAAMSQLDQMVAASEGRLEASDIGESVEGRPLRVVSLRKGTALPRIVIIAGEHAAEAEGTQGAMGAFESALAAADDDPVSLFRVDLLWFSNPDGAVHGWQQFSAFDVARKDSTDETDLCWHHDYKHIDAGRPEDASPEARHVWGWLTEPDVPAFVLNFHSYMSGRSQGYYRAPAELFPEEKRDQVLALDEFLKVAARPSPEWDESRMDTHDHLCSGHMGDYLAPLGCFAYTFEMHNANTIESFRSTAAAALRAGAAFCAAHPR